MPKKRRKPRKSRLSEAAPYKNPPIPPRIELGRPLWPARGAGFQAIIERMVESGHHVPTLTPELPQNYSSPFEAEVDSPRAPLQSGWYQDDRFAAPLYVWVHALEELASEYPDEIDTYRRGIAAYRAHSIWTSDRGEAAHASAEVIASWTPIVAPDPAVVAADRYAPSNPRYRTQAFEEIPADMPDRIAVIDVDYGRVRGQRIPEKWDIDVIGVLTVARHTEYRPVEASYWEQTAFHTIRPNEVGTLATITDEVDLIIGHNLFDGDYRCLRTYADQLDLAPLVAKTVDTLYAARQILSGGMRKPAGLDLTSLAAAHHLRARAKKESRTAAHRGIKTYLDAEQSWFFQPISDDCELTLELWLDMICHRRIRVPSPAEADSVVEHQFDQAATKSLQSPPLTFEEYVRRLSTTGTVYRMEGKAREESVARIHRRITNDLQLGKFISEHGPAVTTRRCMALLADGVEQCSILTHDDQPYCRTHRLQRPCRGNLAINQQCAEIVQGADTHCRWHRITALYVPEGARLYQDFRLALDIPGWEEASTWGYDTGMMTFFAQLYRNGGDYDDSPTIWLSGVNPVYETIVDLRDAIARAARVPITAASAALAASRL
ncbi:hypothetical protein AB0M83_33300 [Amycolatopsis sp. NPDC051106]|uniref:hypothetical protein n=1 Tax=unclassified Amycolatopsis TaxID=2618356 RepID=UPI003441E7D5